jgi:hypothetical protein
MIARTTRPPTPAAVLSAVATSMPSLRTNPDDDAKPHIIKNGVVVKYLTGYLHYEGTCYWCQGCNRQHFCPVTGRSARDDRMARKG